MILNGKLPPKVTFEHVNIKIVLLKAENYSRLWFHFEDLERETVIITREMPPIINNPIGWWMKPMIVAGSKINDTVVEDVFWMDKLRQNVLILVNRGTHYSICSFWGRMRKWKLPSDWAKKTLHRKVDTFDLFNDAILHSSEMCDCSIWRTCLEKIKISKFKKRKSLAAYKNIKLIKVDKRKAKNTKRLPTKLFICWYKNN